MSSPEPLQLEHGVSAELEYLWFGGTPSEAAGVTEGAEFYFYARFNHWGFAVSHDPDTEPSVLLDVDDTSVEHRPKHFTEATIRAHDNGFVRTCFPYGDEEFSASYMPREEILKIIRMCLSQYLKTS